MLGRDKITVEFQRDGVDETREVYGRVVVDTLDPKLPEFASSLFTKRPVNFFRVILPRTLDVSGGSDIRVSFGGRPSLRLEQPIVPIYDGRGRIHHYEAIVRTSG